MAHLGSLVCIPLLVAGCAPRALPASFPADSVASDGASEAPQALVVSALTQDPPLPGEASEGWAGLGAPAGAEGTADPHAGHRGHGAHGGQSAPVDQGDQADPGNHAGHAGEEGDAP